MNILALDTSMGACSAALLRRDGGAQALFARQETMARGHAEALMPMVAEVMSESGIGLRRARSDRGDDRPRQLHRRADRHFRGARPGARDRRQTVRHRQPDGDGERGIALAASQAAHPLPSPSMRGGGCSISASMTETARKLEGPLLIAPDDAAHVLAKRRFAWPSAAAPLSSPKRPPAVASSSRRGCSIFSRARQPLPRSRPRAARPCLCFSPLYLRPPDARPQSARSGGEALMPAGFSVPPGRTLRRPNSGRPSPKLFRAGLGRCRHGAIRRFAPSALPDRLGRRRCRRRAAGFLIARKAGDEAEISDLRRGAVLPQVGSRPRPAPDGHRRSCARAAPSGCFSRWSDGNEAALRLYRSFGGEAVGRRPGYYEHGADAAIFSLAL